MKLIDQLQEIQEESYNKWFERYWTTLNLENKLIQAAQQGYTSYEILIKRGIESENKTSEEEKYTRRRLMNHKTTKAIKDKLGEGFTVEHIIAPYTTKLLGTKFQCEEHYIKIDWEAEA